MTMTEDRCYLCAFADFKTPSENQMSGFCHCRQVGSWHYLPSCQVCVTGNFERANTLVLQKRKEFFSSLGRNIDLTAEF